MSQLRRFLASKPLPSVIDGYVRDGLVLCFDGYQPPSGGVWKDLSGSGNDMIQGSATAYDEVNHCCAFTTSDNYTTGVVPHPLLVTVEAVVSMTTHCIIYRSKTAPWPYQPKLFFGNFLYLAYNKASGSGIAYVNLPTLVSVVPTDDASQPSIYQVWQNDTQSGAWSYRYDEKKAWQSGPGARNADMAETDGQILFGDVSSGNTLRIYALRIYNRCLTQDEMAANRELDIKRFNIK